ncbi:hypothetical protein LX32DRAFT_153287 [Colletotrichum zoysiae]|uniref:Uncharacterized protein n=1 Tax=Colletotrichum zoysiae TaxID=1216348 RepID=A0AAD9HVL0_9PEZI|nr:hypothetical protein LX32DRAFT_153287 [Colletotrichum zoysiae]
MSPMGGAVCSFHQGGRAPWMKTTSTKRLVSLGAYVPIGSCFAQLEWAFVHTL